MAPRWSVGLLVGYGKGDDDLAAALAAQQLGQNEFEAFVARLAAVDAAASSQASAQGTSIDDHVARLQRAARISFGPLASDALLHDGFAGPTPNESNLAPVTPEPAVAELPPVQPEVRGTGVGQLAPDFALVPLGAPTATLGLKDLAGAPAVLSFWTTWCPYCLRQTPVLVDGHDRYAGKSLQFVGVNVKEDETVVKPYVTEHGIPYPILLDLDGAVADQYAVSGYPTTYFLDAAGRIVASTPRCALGGTTGCICGAVVPLLKTCSHT